MFRFTVIILAMSLLQSGCTSVQRVDTSPGDLQAQIRAGRYLREGHDVTIVTKHGKELFFRFRHLKADAIVGTTQLGEPTSVPITEVAGLTTNRLNVGRTMAVVGAGVIGYVAVICALIVVGGAALVL